MDDGKSMPHPCAEDARQVLVAAARRAAARRTSVPCEERTPLLVSGKDLLDVLGGAPSDHASPALEAPRLTPLAKQVLDEAGRVARSRGGADITAADLCNAVGRVMAAWGIDARRLADVRDKAQLT